MVEGGIILPEEGPEDVNILNKEEDAEASPLVVSLTEEVTVPKKGVLREGHLTQVLRAEALSVTQKEPTDAKFSFLLEDASIRSHMAGCCRRTYVHLKVDVKNSSLALKKTYSKMFLYVLTWLAAVGGPMFI